MVLTADGSRTLRSAVHGQTFKSRLGALTESRAVFAEGSGVAARLRSGTPTRVLEIGLGTGLNFLVTAEVARASETPLHYVAVESDLLPATVLRELGYDHALAPSPLPVAFVAWMAELEDWREARRHEAASRVRTHRWRCGPVTLDLVVGDVLDEDVWDVLRSTSASHYDAIYHDAFSPSVSPELWSPVFLRSLATVLAPVGTFVTYSVAGAVRRALAAAGLEVRKVPGPAQGKAEVLVARLTAAPR